MNDLPPIPTAPPKTTDLRNAFIDQIKGMATAETPTLQNILGFFASNDGLTFFEVPFHYSRGSRYSVDHGLYLAASQGLPIFRGFCKVVQSLYSAHIDFDSLLACYLCLFTGRWGIIQTGSLVYPPPGHRPCGSSMDSNALINAFYFGLPMTSGHVVALSKWSLSKSEISATHDDFEPEWWVMHETLYWIMVQSTRP